MPAKLVPAQAGSGHPGMRPWIPALRGACPRARLRRDPGAPAGMTTFECESNVEITTLEEDHRHADDVAGIDGRVHGDVLLLVLRVAGAGDEDAALVAAQGEAAGDRHRLEHRHAVD